MSKQRIFLFIIFFLPAVIMGTGQRSIAARQQADSPLEYKIKAAFLLNFAKFVTWPERESFGKGQPFTLCILGKDPFGPSLAGIESRTVGKRRVHVRYIENPGQINGCRLLFVSSSEREKLADISAALRGQPVVTVSDIRGFSSSGGIFEFVTRGNKLSFIINLAQARKQGLHINASLLNLATEVIR